MTILDKIFAEKRADLPELERRHPLPELRAKIADLPPTRGFRRALEKSLHRPSLIAEVKAASPSMGTIRPDFDPVSVGKAYVRAGADCLSVLTDENHFRGSRANLVACRAATGLPILRKDFTTSAYHIYEAREMGADAVLLIVAGLTQRELGESLAVAGELGLDALVEAHTLEEAEAALALGAELVGINNRDLRTFETKIETSEAIIPHIRGRATVVSESALACRADVDRVCEAGARAVLIGTAFCREPDVEAAVTKVMAW